MIPTEFFMPKKVKWAISILLVCIATLLLALPKLVGIVIQDAIADGVFEQINASTEGRITITNSQTETGWFRSIIQLNIEISDIRNQLEPHSLLVHGKISHGPILPTQSLLSFGLVNVDMTVNADTLQSELVTIMMDPLTVSLRVKFDQSLSISAMVPNIGIRNVNLHTTVDGLDAYVHINEDLSAKADIKSNEILIQNNQSNIQLTVSNPSLHLATDRLDDVSAGSAITATIPSTIASKPLAFNLNNTILDWRSHPSNKGTELTDFSQSIKVEKIESDLPLESISWKSEMRGVKEELIKSYNELLLKIQSASDVDPIVRMTELTQVGNETGLLLLQNEVNLVNIIEADLYQGIHKLNLNVLWKGLPSINNIDNFRFEDAVEALDIELNLLLDQESVSISPFAELAEHYSSQNYLTSSSDRLNMHAELTQGSLTINDESFPLERLLQ